MKPEPKWQTIFFIKNIIIFIGIMRLPPTINALKHFLKSDLTSILAILSIGLTLTYSNSEYETDINSYDLVHWNDFVKRFNDMVIRCSLKLANCRLVGPPVMAFSTPVNGFFLSLRLRDKLLNHCFYLNRAMCVTVRTYFHANRSIP